MEERYEEGLIKGSIDSITKEKTEKILDQMKKCIGKVFGDTIGKKKDDEETIYLNIKENHLLYPKPMNETQISNSLKQIKKLIEIDKNRTKLIEQRNKLEALIFSRKEWLDSEHSKKLYKRSRNNKRCNKCYRKNK